MIFSFYSKRLATNIIALTFACLAVFTYGRWHYFDIFAIGVFTSALFISRFNINTTATITIIVTGRLIETLAFYFIQNTLLAKACIYVMSLLVLYIARHDKFFLPSVIIFVLCIVSEQWWYQIDYPAPEIFYSMLTVAISLVVRQMLIVRPYIVYHLTGKSADFTRLDWHLAKIYGLAIMLESIYVAEYLIRHIIHINVTFIYAVYPILMHALGAFTLYLIFKYVLETRMKNKMIA